MEVRAVVGVIIGLGVEVGVTVAVGVGLAMQMEKVQGREVVGVGVISWAGAGNGAVGAIGFLPIWYSFIAVNTAIPPRTMVARTISINDQLFFILAIHFIVPDPRRYIESN